VVAAQAARLGGDLGRARSILQRAISASRALTHVGEDARLLAELARVELDADHHAEAERQARSGLALVRAGVGDHESGTRCLVVLGELARREGRIADAELLLEEAAATRPPGERTDAWREASLILGQCRLDAGDPERALELLDAADDPPTEEIRLRAALDALRTRLGA
jgi:tetratricopeptide (TPR) repeat protein